MLHSKEYKKATIEYVNVQDDHITDKDKISNCFNSHFSSIGSKLARSLPAIKQSPLTYLTNNYPDFNPSDTDPEEITSIIKSLKDYTWPRWYSHQGNKNCRFCFSACYLTADKYLS